MYYSLQEKYKKYKHWDIYNIYDLLYYYNKDQDIYYNILNLLHKQKLVKHILLHIYYYNLLHMFEFMGKLLQDIFKHKIQIFYQHKNFKDSISHIILFYYLHIITELQDMPEHMIQQKDLHNKAMGIQEHKNQFNYMKNNQQGNNVRINYFINMKAEAKDIYQHMIWYNSNHMLIRNM